MIAAHALVGAATMHLARKFYDDERSWIVTGIVLAFLSHAIVDTLAIFTYHDASPSGSLFSRSVFWFWIACSVSVFVWGARVDWRYLPGMISALAFDIWDHWILRTISCAPRGFPDGCMSIYAYEHLHFHQMEWFFLDTFFLGVERYYGNPSFFLVEIGFVAAMVSLIYWLRRSHPLEVTSDEL